MKIRLDHLLVQNGIAHSRSKAQALIASGNVLVHGKVLTKASLTLDADAPVEVSASDHPYVSRGGMKLAHALAHFSIDPAGAVAADIGASTGGFTDVLLKNGAARVYAVDVGHAQLHATLLDDPRIVNLEGINARYLNAQQVPEPLDAIVCDASFISLKLVLPAVLDMAKPGAWLVALIKPQFEAGKERVGKQGVVRDPALHAEICEEIRAWLEASGWHVQGIVDSPITGPKGNHEFLVYAIKA